MTNFFEIAQDENKNFVLSFTDTFYKKMSPYYRGDSYCNVLYRLFGLLPQDFYHYCGITYAAQFRPSESIRHVQMYWTDKNNAEKFCKEANLRMNKV